MLKAAYTVEQKKQPLKQKQPLKDIFIVPWKWYLITNWQKQEQELFAGYFVICRLF